jgi:hypothetical protein
VSGPATPAVTRQELRQIAKARLRDAEALCQANRFDGGLYLCGYAVETALKARICRTLKWSHWPSKGPYNNFHTHDFDVLLRLSGVETKIRARYLIHWSIVAGWDPESRYAPIGNVGKGDLMVMIASAEILMKALA